MSKTITITLTDEQVRMLADTSIERFLTTVGKVAHRAMRREGPTPAGEYASTVLLDVVDYKHGGLVQLWNTMRDAMNCAE